MKIVYLIFLLLLTYLCSIAQVRVRGYTKSNGTYVQPHYRSKPDGNPYNNWSYPGNTNPYTGKVATGDQNTYLNNYNNRSSTSTNQSSTNTSNYYSSGSPANYDSNNSPSGTSQSYNYTSTPKSPFLNINSNAEEEIRTRTSSQAKFKLTPNIYESNYISIPSGTYVKVLDKTTDFWRVEYNGKIGYVNEVYLSPNYEIIGSAGYKFANLIPVENVEAKVKISGDLRSGPDTQYAAIKKLKKADAVLITGRVGAYFQVKSGADVGYVNEVLLDYVDAASTITTTKSVKASDVILQDLPSVDAIPTDGILTTVKIDASLRNGPNTSYKVILTVPKESTIEVIGGKNGYYLVRYNTQIGYMNDVYFHSTPSIIAKYKK